MNVVLNQRKKVATSKKIGIFNEKYYINFINDLDIEKT